MAHSYAPGTEGRHYPYIDNSVETLKDPTTELLVATVTTTNTVDAATGALTDNVTTIVEASTANGAQSGVTHYSATHYTLFNDFFNNCFGLPEDMTVTESHNASSGTGTAVTRKMTTIWNGTHCRPERTEVEPGDIRWQVATDFGYDGFGNVSSATVTPAANQGQSVRATSMNWGATGRFLESITNPEGEVTQQGWNAFGVRNSMTDPNGLVTSWTLDAFGRVTREDRPDNTATDFVLEWCTSAVCQDGDSWIRTQLSTIVRDTADEEVSRSIAWFDMLDRQTRAQSQVHSSTTAPKLSIVRQTFNNRGLPAQVSLPYVSGETAYYTAFTYDDWGRPLLARRRTSVEDSSDHDTIWTYDGLSTTIKTPLNRQVIQRRSVVGEIVALIDGAGTTTYAYDAFSNLASAQSPGSSPIVMGYNVRGLKTSLNDPNLGAWTFDYYPLGELKSTEDANGNVTTFEYDRLSRQRFRNATNADGVADGTIEWTWGVGANDQKNVGKLIGLGAPGLQESYLYDEFARLSRRRIVSDATYDYNYDYNTLGLLRTLTYPVSTGGYRLALRYSYDFGLLRQIADANAPSTIFWRGGPMNASGGVTQQVLGNGVVTNIGIDDITRLVGSIQSGVGGGAALQNESYLYDPRGNMSQRQNYKLGLTENFYYDSLDRLDIATVDTGHGVVNLDMNYDSAGNITSRSDVANGASWTYHGTKSHAVIQAGPNTYGYDANGNVVSRNGSEIKWTTDNLPWQIAGPGKLLTFSYGPSRERFRQVYNSGSLTETTEYIGGMLEKVTAGGVVDWRHYISVNGGTVAIRSRKSTGANITRYLLTDPQHSISDIVDATGASYVSESFAPFGSRRDAADWDADCNCTDLGKMKEVTRRGYTEHEMIGGVSMKLIHMNGRVLDSQIGRFLSADPFVSAPYVSQSLNRYSYVLNNPMSAVDPSGFAPCASVTQYDIDGIPSEAAVVGCDDFGGQPSDYGMPSYAWALDFSIGGGGGGGGGYVPPAGEVPTVNFAPQSSNCAMADQLMQELGRGLDVKETPDPYLTGPAGNAVTLASAAAQQGAKSTRGEAFVRMTSDAADGSLLGPRVIPTNAEMYGPYVNGLQRANTALNVAQLWGGYASGGVEGLSYASIDVGVSTVLGRLGWPGALGTVGYNMLGGSKTIVPATATAANAEALQTFALACAIGL